MKHLSCLVLSSALVTTAFAQTTVAPNQPPAPPRSDAPGTPVNPAQTTPETPPPAGMTAASTPVRALVFAEADTDKDGRISINEYTTYVENRMATRSTEAIREETMQRFLDLDQNNDAFLSEPEASATPPAPSAQVPPAPPPRR